MELIYQVDSQWVSQGYSFHRVARFGTLFDALVYAFTCRGWFKISKCELLYRELAYPVSLVARSATYQGV